MPGDLFRLASRRAEIEEREGWGKHDAIIESMRVNFTPVFLVSATTSICFLGTTAREAVLKLATSLTVRVLAGSKF